MSIETEVKQLRKDFLIFVKQYELDMRGDKKVGNGDKGIIGSVRHLIEYRENFPSTTWLLTHKPIPTIAIIVAIYVVLDKIAIEAEDLLLLILSKFSL